MEMLVALIFTFTIIIIAMLFIWTICDWSYFCSTPPYEEEVKAPKFKWDYIKKIYVINPDKWKKSTKCQLIYDGYYIRLSYFDFLKFLFAYRKYIKEKDKNKENQKMEAILKNMQEDIENYKKRNLKIK